MDNNQDKTNTPSQSGSLQTRICFHLCRFLWRCVLRICFRVEIRGLENLKAVPTRAVLIANHTSYLDASLLACFLPRRLTYAVGDAVARKWWIRPFVKLVDFHPLSAGNPFAFKSLIKRVSDGGTCLIFPEGRLTTTGTLMKCYEGTARLAVKADADLVPISIDGADRTLFTFLRGKGPRQWFPRIRVTIHKPERIEAIRPRLETDPSGTLRDILCNALFESRQWRKTLNDALCDAARDRGNGTHIANDATDHSLTYGSLIMKSTLLGDKIAQQTRIGEHVGILLPTCTAKVIAYFALQSTHRIAALLDPHDDKQTLRECAKVAGIRLVLTSRFFIRKAKLSDAIESLKNNGVEVACIEDLAKHVRFTDILRAFFKRLVPTIASLTSRTRAAKAFQIPSSQLPDAPSTILFERNQQGEMTGVALSHTNLTANVEQLRLSLPVNWSDRVLCTLPTCHAFGLTGGILLPLLRGIPTFLYPMPTDYRNIPDVAYHTSSTILFSTNTLLQKYATCANPYDFESVRLVIGAGDGSAQQTGRLWLEKFGIRVLQAYGKTAMGPAIALNSPVLHTSGTLGKLLPGIECRFVSGATSSKAGQLFVKGPNLMTHRLSTDHPGQLIPVDGWLDTGDSVQCDERGFLSSEITELNRE